MTEAAEKQDTVSGSYARLVAPGFITFTEVTPPHAEELEFVITNEATGKYFLANQATVQFFSLVKETGSVPVALSKAGIPSQQGENLVKRLVQSGLLVRSGETQSEAEKKAAPLESKLISLRWDMIDAARLTERFGWLGRVLYSPVGYLAWFGIMVAMVQALLSNSEKLNLGLRQVFDADWRQFLMFAGIYVVLKIIHEMGHALAYQTMCHQENVSPGPIRMGISIFAFTPFPFTDVTGAWRLRSVFRRVMIGGGGIYFETWAIALLTLFWAQTQSGMLQTIILQVAVFAGVIALLFNLNPAIKLDGYYMLTDYLRRPNLSGRASLAARNFVARRLGAETPEIVTSDLAYWVLSYVYRWTIFAGIFWLIYQFDKRLGPVAVAVIVMTLIARPIVNTLKYAVKLGIRPFKTALSIGFTAAALGLLFIPFPDRILLPGQLRTFETQFIEVTESGTLQLNGQNGFALDNPQITQEIIDVDLRVAMLENLSRAAQSSAAEKQSLQVEIASFRDTSAELKARIAPVQYDAQVQSVWTSLVADQYEQAWVDPAEISELAAYSVPVAPYLQLRLDQSLLEREITLTDNMMLRVRAVHDPGCEFPAQLLATAGTRLAVDGRIEFRAKPDTTTQGCASGLTHGGAVIARLDTKSRSILERIQFAGARLLQNRLEIDQQ